MKGIGLRDKISVDSREFQVHTGNDPLKNIVKSEVFEKGKFLFSAEDPYSVRENKETEIDEEYLKDITFEQHQNTLDEIKILFLVNEKIKQIRQHLPHFRLGKVFLNRNFIDEAINNLKRVVELKPDFVRGHIKLGLAYFKQTKYMDAIKAFLQAHKIEPEYPDILNNLGVTYAKTNNFAAASKFLKKALEIKPNFKEANFNLGIVLFLSSIADDEDESKVIIPARFIRSFKEILKMSSFQSKYWHERFILTQQALEEGKKKNVVAALEKIQSEIMFQEDSSDIMDYFFLQFMFGGSELKHTKLDFFEELITAEVERNNTYADYWNELGIIHLVQCREYFTKAIAEFEKSTKIDPDFETAQKNTELLRHNKQGFLILLRAILK
ncbi:MAG: tetratricopeptide repeat protein [Calditrichaeota bacterium]|nr:tetratricopeptide repeat protein [Calditrichota bacterium]